MKPVPVRQGDTVAVVAPSSAFDRDKFLRGVQALQTMGLRPRYSDAIFGKYPPQDSYLAGDDARRQAELEAALGDDSRAIVLARGGYGLLRFAARLRVAPGKLVVGYSDCTVLHEVWWRAKIPSIHGPMCTQLGEDPPALARLQALLFGKEPGPIEWTANAARAGRVEGPLRGGNLASLASLCGTALQPAFAGSIVLLEDLNEPPYRLDRLLTQLLESGVLSGALGFVVGDLVGPGESSAGRVEAVAERLLPLGVPVVFEAPFGHAGRNQPVAFGCVHALDAGAGKLVPLEAPTC